MSDQIMNFKEAMSFLKIPRSTLYKLVQEGRVPAIKVGRHWRFSREILEKWISGDEASSSIQKMMGPDGDNRPYCWQMDGRKSDPDHDCTMCLTYRVRAMNCFLLRSELGKNGADQLQCISQCKECNYFKEHFD